MSLQGKRALVTGGSRGIGAATALRLAELGVSVAINYNTTQDRAEQVAAKAREQGVTGWFLTMTHSRLSAAAAVIAVAEVPEFS